MGNLSVYFRNSVPSLSEYERCAMKLGIETQSWNTNAPEQCITRAKNESLVVVCSSGGAGQKHL